MSQSASRERELLLRRGMGAWMEAWSGYSQECVEEERPGRQEAPREERGEEQAALPPGLRAEVTELLAGITWSLIRS